jgi:radical SAM superfamily enzyme YgiQ (UPF0313 family)
VQEITRVIAILKIVAPEVVIIVGGPEVSHEHEGQEIVRYADYVITGPGELSFAKLSRQILQGIRPCDKFITGESGPLAELQLPYSEYSDEDIRQRVLYVEAARGCPFKCEFCLSALDKTAKPFNQERLLAALGELYVRGVRRFKFVDRTFNLDIASASNILAFFLERLDEHLFLHFEIIPDRLPEALKLLIARFPVGSLQFEVGVQSLNPDVQRLISRKQDNAMTEANLAWLRQQTQAHIHADLIVGLPGEDIKSFSHGFDRLHALGAHEIQVGLLKRLRGAPIARHAQKYGLRFNPMPPYEILATNDIDFENLRRLSRFARYWDIVANSGRFTHTMACLTHASPFNDFMRFADWLYERTRQTHELALERLWLLVDEYLIQELGLERDKVRSALGADFARTGLQGIPTFLKNFVPPDARKSLGAKYRHGRMY